MIKFFIRFLFLCILLAPFEAEALKMGKIKVKIPGGKKNPTGMLIKALTAIPKQVIEFSKLAAAANVTIATIRMASSNPKTPPDQLQAMSLQLDELVNNIQAKIVTFKKMPVILTLDKLSETCGSPMMSAAMAAPYIGTAVAGLCGKIATVDLKVDMLLGRAEFLLANALTAKEAMFARMNAAQAAGVSGMMQGAMPAGVSGMMQGAMPGGVPGMMQGGAMPGGMVPPGMPNPKQFIDNGMPNEDSQYGADVGG